MIPKATQIDTDQAGKDCGLKRVIDEPEKVEAEAVPGPFVAALSPELRAIFEAGWANNESAYRKLAR